MFEASIILGTLAAFLLVAALASWSHALPVSATRHLGSIVGSPSAEGEMTSRLLAFGAGLSLVAAFTALAALLAR